MTEKTAPAEIMKMPADKRLKMLQVMSRLTVDLLALLIQEETTDGRTETERTKEALVPMCAKEADFRRLGEAFEADMVRIAALAGLKAREVDGEIRLERPNDMSVKD